MSMPKIRGFRGWVVNSSAKARAFQGWIGSLLPPARVDCTFIVRDYGGTAAIDAFPNTATVSVRLTATVSPVWAATIQGTP